MIKNKRGWIKIVEAFTAVLLIMTVVIIVIDRGYAEKNDVSKKIYETQIQLLGEIISNFDITTASEEDIDEYLNPSEGKSRVPNYMECVPLICSLEDLENPCNGEEIVGGYEGNIYVQTALVLDENDVESNDRQLKLFCWVKI